jgi:hypothetical protein
MTHHRHKHANQTQGQGKQSTMSNAADNNGHDGTLPIHEDIRLGAYHKWEAAGKPTGDGVQYWLEAEQDLV